MSGSSDHGTTGSNVQPTLSCETISFTTGVNSPQPDAILSLALRELDKEVVLSSFVGKNYKDDLGYHAQNIWGVPLSSYLIAETVSFTYYHGL